MTQPDDRTRDRLRGAAVGAAIGDALGMPLEFKPPRPLDNLLREMVRGRIPAGSITDDTEMALALAESLLAHGALVPEDAAGRFVDWYHTHPPDIGIHTRSVLSRIAGGEPWQDAANAVQRGNPDSAGNGSLMRCWPAAVFYWDDADALVAASRLQSDITHPHRDCADACAFANLMVYDLVNGQPLREAFEQARGQIEFTEAFDAVIAGAEHRERADLPNTGWVRRTLESALWALFTTDSFEEALVQAVNLGEDADTTGAVVGFLAGAYYGYSTIPPRWLNALRGEWPVGSGQFMSAPDFARLADDLAGRGQGSR